MATNTTTHEQLAIEWLEWCNANGYEPMDAYDLLMCERVNMPEAHVWYVLCFIQKWDNVI